MPFGMLRGSEFVLLSDPIHVVLEELVFRSGCSNHW
jgi:hypothetical protein